MLLPPPLFPKPLIDERFLKASGRNRILSHVGLKLDTTTAGADTERIWQHVATEGEYNGYAGGTRGFTFAAQLFTQIVGNFKNHPSYVRGGDGLGSADVVAWDFAHASEQHSAIGSLPVAGAPAQGWVQELQTRINPAGTAELWALTKWLEPARTYVKEGRYAWASVAVTFDAVDALTGKIIGPVLTSVALTNQPFIEGMNKLAASRSHQTNINAERLAMYLEPADTPERALEMIRSMLTLPETADAAAVASELNKVKTWASAGESPQA